MKRAGMLLRPRPAAARVRLASAAVVVLAAIGLAQGAAAASPGRPAAPLSILSASNPHPDLVSGGEVLLRITAPASLPASRIRISLNSADVTRDFAAQPDGTLLGLVKGLRNGPNDVTAQVEGGGRAEDARLLVVNHPITGPVFSGPQQQPFYCQTTSFGLAPARQPYCSAPTRVSYEYMSTSGQYKPWPAAGAPARPYPADLAATTVDGHSVPYIVRLEQGTIDRGVYQIAVLYDGHAPSPYTRDTSWNGRLIYTFGGGFNAGYHQGTTTGGVIDAAAGPGGEDLFLGQGYAVASNSLDVLGTDGSMVIPAEAAMMTKEHFIDTYGAPAYTIGWGASGGAVQQYGIADAYPGILNGIIPTISFPNANGTTEDYVSDCRLLDNYFAAHPGYTQAQKTATSGFGSYETCQAFGQSITTQIGSLQPGASCDSSIPATVPGDPATVWNATTNPRGVKCLVLEQIVNQLGTDPATGFPYSYIDNVGVQYGLAALDSGAITAAQFADLNASIGGWNYLGSPSRQRTQASPVALREMYADDLNDCGCQGLKSTAIIDHRNDEDLNTGLYSIHPSVESFITRARMQAAGDAANQVIIEENDLTTDTVQDENANAYELSAMNQWLDDVSHDGAARPVQAKIASDKPAGLTDGCFLNDQQTSPTPQPGGLTADGRDSPCESAYPVYSNPRIAAGQPENLYALKCALTPLNWASYSVTFTSAEKAELERAFPHGICDYSKPGPGERPPAGTWLNYSHGTTPFRS
jgi:uncharacterized tannase-like protein DUF6351